MSAWIPKTKNIYDDDYKFLYEYPINYSNISRRLRKIICNNEICHAITENGLVFSWGNDIYHKGTLGLGNNIFQVNTPVLNKYLSKERIFDISLSEEHCAAIDYNNYLYTWGVEEHGELGYFDENEKKVCEPIRISMNKKPFLVNKVKCGKYYTAGINNKGIPFLFGNKTTDNYNTNNEIIFFSFNNNMNYNLVAKDIYCGEYFIIIHLEHNQILIYSFNDGLFEINLNYNINNENKINYIISKINIIDKNFYFLDEKNNRLFEFIYDNRNFNKPFNIKEFYQNEYEVNPGIKLSIIEMPFFVKFLFFWIECSENEKKEFISQTNKMFNKLNDKKLLHNCVKGPNINEYILFGNNKKKIELIKIDFINLYNKKERHFILKGDYFYSNYKNNINTNIMNNNTNINIDSSFQSLNIPISQNYGNKNDVYDYDKNKINFDFSNNKEKNIKKDYNIYNKKSVKYNYNYGYREYRKNYSISHDRKRNTINDTEYEKEQKDEFMHKINKNIITLDNNDINNNISIVTNKKKENNSFLLKIKSNLNTNDNIKENNEKYNYNQIPIKNTKKRSNSQIKIDKNHNNAHNISSVNTNINNSKKEKNEFDNILKNINNRRLMLNQPIKIENNHISTKKILSQMGKTKSKTEMLIKELQETFFGKDNIINNNNLTHKNDNNNNVISYEEKEKDEKYEKEKKSFIRIKEIDEKEKQLKKEKKEREEKMKREEEEREKERLRKEIEKNKKERLEKEILEKELKINEEKERMEKIRKEKEEKERLEKIRKEKERIKKEKEKIEKERKEQKEKEEKEEKERMERIKKEKEKIEKENKEKERIERELIEKKEKERLELEQKKLKEKKEREKQEKEEIERLNQMRLEKEKLEKEIQEIKEKKEKEYIMKEKLEKERKEKEKIEEEKNKKKEELLEKEIREKLENEYKEKYKKEKIEKEKEQKKEREKLEKIEKEKNEKINIEKKIAMEKIKELEKKNEILEKIEKEKILMDEQRKNLLITSEINNFIEGKNINIKTEKNLQNFKFLPERLKTENENDFIMKGTIKKNYNYTISGNQQFNIENHQLNKNININLNDNSKKNISDIMYINSNNELNFNIEDIFSTRDMILDNNVNNISGKIESLEIENKNFVQDLPLKLVDSNNIPKIKNNKVSNNIFKDKNNSTNKINNQEEQNENSLKFAIEDNINKVDICNNKDKDDSLEMTNTSNKKNEKEKNNQLNINLNISDEENDNDAPETVLELEENKKKLNFNWKEKSKNRISEIIEEKQELEMIQSIDDTLQNKNNKNEFNIDLPLPYKNYQEQPIVPVSEISTNNMRHISTYDQNIISSTRKFEPKELDDITGSLRFFSNRSANSNLFSMINKQNNKPISQRNNNNININSNINSNNNSNMKPYYGVGEKNKNMKETNLIKNEGLLNESYKDTNPNENIKDQKMKIDDLEQSKLLKESKNVENVKYNNENSNFNEELNINKNIKLNKIIKLKSKEELNVIITELKKIEENNNKGLDESLYFLLENDMDESNFQNSNGRNSQIIKVKNNKITTFDSESNLLENNALNQGLFFNYNNNKFNDKNFKNNIFTNLNNFNNFNNMNNPNNFNNIIINNDNNFNNINYINEANNERLLNIKNNPHNNHTFKEIKNVNINKYFAENKYERHTYIGRHKLNILNNIKENDKDISSHQNDNNTNMIKGVQIKSIHNKTKSHGKDSHKKHKKKTGIIEQIKKEQNEKKSSLMFSTFNQKNKNIFPIPINNSTPYTNNKTQPYSKNSVAKIEYNNMNIYQFGPQINNTNIKQSDKHNSNSNFVHHNKSKSVNINKCLSSSPKKRSDDLSKYNFESKEKNNYFIYDNNNINNNNFIINKDNNYNYNEEEIQNIIIKQTKENNSFILLRQKYLEFLIKVYGKNNNIPVNKEAEELDNNFLKGLVKNEVPIENINLNLLNCSNDMKNFICQSLENFKLQLLKEKISKINEDKNSYLNNNIEKNIDNKNNNLNGLIQLDYEDEIKDKSNILEPIELEKSNYNLNFRKSFIESLSGLRNDKIFYNSENIIKK